MKKMFVTSLLCLMSLNAFSQRPYVIHGTAIEWHVCIVNPHNGSGPLIPKSPALPPQTPEASIDALIRVVNTIMSKDYRYYNKDYMKQESPILC